MNNVDKTVRIGVDSSGASQGINNIRQEADKANASSVEGLKEQIRLIKQKGSLEEEFARKKIRNTQEDIRYAERELQLWKLQREEQSRGLRGEKRKRFDTATSEEETSARKSILQDKGTLSNLRGTAEDEKSYRKKQLTLLQEQLETQKINKLLLERVLSGATGDVGGAIKAIGGPGAILATAVAGAAYLAVMNASANEQSVRVYSQNMRENPSYSLIKSAYSEDIGETARITGKSARDFIEQDYARYQRAYGARDLRGGHREGYELAGAERVTGLSGQQIEQVLTISRYSGASATGQISMMENYLTKTGQSLVRLPEIMTSYLSVANNIFQKTGVSDPIAVQRMMQSVGMSYGVQGINLDRVLSAVQQITGPTQNDIMRGLQYQAIRKAYPSAGYVERLKILQNPEQYKDYAPALFDIMGKVGGGSDQALMFARGLTGGNIPIQDLQSILAKKYRVAEGKGLGEDYYSKKSAEMIGGGERTSADLKDMGQILTAHVSALLQVVNKGMSVFQPGSPEWEAASAASQKNYERAVENGMNSAIKKNQNILSK